MASFRFANGSYGEGVPHSVLAHVLKLVFEAFPPVHSAHISHSSANGESRSSEAHGRSQAGEAINPPVGQVLAEGTDKSVGRTFTAGLLFVM